MFNVSCLFFLNFQGIVHEAIAFVHFALCLFSQDFIPQRSFHHLHLYIQRVALSVLLPIPASSTPLPLTTQSSLDQGSVPAEFGTFPRKKNKEGGEGTPRRRAPTVPGPGYEVNPLSLSFFLSLSLCPCSVHTLI